MVQVEDERARDKRTLRQKLQDMASQDDSPLEAEIARAKLADMPTSRTLSRAQILATPNIRHVVGLRRVYDPFLHVTVVLDDDDPAFSAPDLDWDGVE